MKNATLSAQGLGAWTLCNKLSIVQAALLALGLNPSEYEISIKDKPAPQNPLGYDALFQAMKDAVETGTLPASVVSKDLAAALVIGIIPDEKHIIEKSETDWKATTVQVADFKAWLLSKNVKPDFFFAKDAYDICNKQGAFYAPKLLAAIKAWEAVTGNNQLLKNKSPRKALIEWLEQHADEYGLSKQAIDEISKIANWKPEGGAPSTASKKET